ncbi:MAG: VIT domain-containing protein, partial [Myxococcota bacterium]
MKRFAPFARTSTLALLALTACGGNEAAPGSGPGSTVGTVHSIAGAYQLGEDSQRGVQRMQTGAELSVGEGARASLEHDAGPWILLDGSTSVSADLESVTLQSGKLFIDARRGALRVATTGGEIRAEGATFAVEGNTVYCASGELTWTAEGGESGLLAQGESLAFDGSPAASAAGLWDDWTGGLADPAPWHLPESSYVGSLLGRRPNELGKARRPISVRAHEVDVAIRGDFAITTVTQTFFNAESETLEAHYAMRLPDGAIVSSFSADMGNGFMNASVTPLEWNVNPYYTPSEQRLAYDGEGRVRARVSPIGPGDTVRLRTTYAHWMDRRGDTRTYVYPMVDAGSEPPLVGEFRLTVDTSGNRITATRAGMGAEVEDGRVVLRRSDYRPTADFHLDLIEAGSASEDAVAYIVTAPAYEAGLSEVAADGDERFVLVDMPTSALNGWDEGEEGGVPPLDLALVVDVSGGTAPEDLELARAVVESTLRQLAPDDRVSLQLGDVRAHPPEGLDGTFLSATPENAERLLEALASVPLGGATDLGAMLRDASELVADAPRGAVLYVGDGTATTGQLDATAIGARLATVEGAPRIFALALGEASGTDLLRRITDRTEAVSLRTDAARAIMRILADATRPTLRGATVDFGETVERVYPSMPTTLTLDRPLRFVGRLRGDMPDAIVLRGRRAGEDVERTINVRNGTVQDDGDIRRRWASSRLLELVDQDAGREALVSLGMRYDLLTPWTSLSAGMGKGAPYNPVVTFDRDPVESVIVAPAARTGWRRRERTRSRSTRVAAESTWTPRVR